MEDKLPEHQHDFDGIEELDNDLPGWWLGIFWVTFLVALVYVPYYHFMNPDKLPAAAWEKATAAVEAERAEVAAAAPKGDDLEQQLWAKYEAGDWKDAAQASFNTYCVPCHLVDGGGSIGPNFTDDYTIHGGKLSDMVRVIVEGVPEKGMVSWKTVLKPEEIEQLAFYIRDFRGTTPAVAKPPQGRKVDEKGEFIEGEAPAEDSAEQSSGL